MAQRQSLKEYEQSTIIPSNYNELIQNCFGNIIKEPPRKVNINKYDPMEVDSQIEEKEIIVYHEKHKK